MDEKLALIARRKALLFPSPPHPLTPSLLIHQAEDISLSRKVVEVERKVAELEHQPKIG